MSETPRPDRLLPRPDPQWYRRAAKKRLKALRAEKPDARLAEAQLLIARRHGFASWRKLAAAIAAAVVENERSTQAVAAAAPSVVAWSVDALPAHRRSHKIAQWKPIMDAAFRGDADAVAKLLDGGADPNVVSSTPHRYRPLHRAIERKKTMPRGPGHLAVVKLLLARGADPRQRMASGHTALQLAAVESPVFVPLLRDRFEPLDFWHALALLDEKRVAKLLTKDPSLAVARADNGWQPLHYLAASAMFTLGPKQQRAQANIARHLLSAEADIGGTFLVEDKWPIPPLYYACGYHDNSVLAEQLIKAGASPCDQESVYHASDEGHTACLDVIERLTPPADLAAECTRCLPVQLHFRRTAGAAWLLAHGADPNAINKHWGRSAMHEAAVNGAADATLRLLLNHGGDPHRETSDGKTAIDLARANGKNRVVKTLSS